MPPLRPQPRPPLVANFGPNYRPRGQPYRPRGGGPVDNDKFNNHRRQSHPYFGPKAQYRAQVIDYSNGGPQNGPAMPSVATNRFPNDNRQTRYLRAIPRLSRLLTSVDSSPRPSSPMTMTQAGLLPTPQSNLYPNARYYGQSQHSSGPPSPSRSLLPTPHNPTAERFNYSPNQQMPSYRPTVQMYNQRPATNIIQPTGHPTPQPVPPPMANRMSVAAPIPTPHSALPQTNSIQPIITNVKTESNVVNNQKLEESRINAVMAEGMEYRVQNDLKGFYCQFCEVFCINLIAAERHVESPKHQRVC